VIDQLNSLRLDRRWDRPTGVNNRTLDQVCLSAYDCFNILEPDLPGVQALMNEIRLTWEHTGVVRAHEDEISALVERASRGATIKFKNSKRTRYTASTYQNIAQLAALGRKFYASGVANAAAGQVAICLSNAGTFAARQLSHEFAPCHLYANLHAEKADQVCLQTGKYVSEHVTELQTPAMFSQSLIDNQFPDGTTPAGISTGYNWEDGATKASYKPNLVNQCQCRANSLWRQRIRTHDVERSRSCTPSRPLRRHTH
jgi:hypothetical protein